MHVILLHILLFKCTIQLKCFPHGVLSTSVNVYICVHVYLAAGGC